MGTLSSCLNKVGLSKIEKEVLRGAADANKSDGDAAHIAAVRAVADFIERVEKERGDVTTQILKQGGRPTDAPFSIVNLAHLTAVLRGEGDVAASNDVETFGGFSIENPRSRFMVAQRIADMLVGENSAKLNRIDTARSVVAELFGIKSIEAGTQNAKLADELIEVGVVLAGRKIVSDGRSSGKSKQEIYQSLVTLYENQPNLNVRTSTSVREQAYSTPAPLAYLASEAAGITQNTVVYEPTAGNGMLLLGASQDKVIANELNKDRFAMLSQVLPDADLSNGDATQKTIPAGSIDALIANPPFGIVKNDAGETVIFQTDVGYETREIDHAIAFKSLASLPDDGRAVLIVGGVRADNEEGRVEGYRSASKRNFYYNLYQNYNVADHFTVNGDLYKKQGAAYPVDVIVIAGRGKSSRVLPAANLPKVFNSWNELQEVLNNAYSVVASGRGERLDSDGSANKAGQDNGSAVAGSSGRSGAVDGGSQRESATGAGAGVKGSESGGRDDSVGAGKPSRADSGTEQLAPSRGNGEVEPKVSGSGNSERGRAGDDGRSGNLGGSRSSGTKDVTASINDRRGQESETDMQVSYIPRSMSPAVGTLVPINMRDSTQNSLDLLEDSVGNLDEYVAGRLEITLDQLRGGFSAEQVDALAMAISNAESGGGFIIGDQTGIGKGRIVAGMIRYAINRGLTPVFVTEKPNLYADMLRDLNDIGMGDLLGYGTKELKILMTNDEKIPYGNDGEFEIPKLKKSEKDAILLGMAEEGYIPKNYMAVFTTYSQLQTLKGAVTSRMNAVSGIAPNAYLILDESHNAGGTGGDARKTSEDKQMESQHGFSGGRAGFLRMLVGKAKASFFSSATYAKRPNVMDLYSSTNMSLAVEKPSQLGEAIARGGVPMQQIVATMLAKDGQYMRRERSFNGVTYDTGTVFVDKQTAENMAEAMSKVLKFSRAKESAVKNLKKDLDAVGALMSDLGSDAKFQVAGANFASTMHNLIDQMLLSLKAKGAIDEAIKSLEAGEKVVLTVANTMGSFIADYAADMGLSVGDAVNLSFTDLYLKYLEKQRWVSVKNPGGTSEKRRLTDEELGPGLSNMFYSIGDWIRAAGFGEAPISPIDYMHSELRKHKINGRNVVTDEITGRTATLNYTSGGSAVLASRSSTIKSRLSAINGFNSGKIDLLILNQSGSTGLSLHASEKFADKRKRKMIIVQAEKNIDTHMQMLGRVHRTGQVVTPAYIQLMADIPAEMRPAAVLMGKMAKLSANTTANKDSAFSAEGVTDFMNVYGGQVAVEYLLENQDLYHKLGGNDMMSLSLDEAGEDEIRKLTGYIPLLPIAMQERVYNDLITAYKEVIQRETELGTNVLEARALDLDAETLSSEMADEGKKDSKSLFAAPVTMERVSIKRTSKPLTSAQVEELVLKRLEGLNGRVIALNAQRDLDEKVNRYVESFRNKRVDEGAEPATIENQVGVITATARAVKDKLITYTIGSSHTINRDGQIYYGIVTDVKSRGGTENPASQSAWSVQFALAMADANMVTIPMSQLGTVNTKFITEQTYSTMWGDLASGGSRSVRISELFDLAQTSGREKRWMVTGNLLAGYSRFQGSLVHYTKNDGTTAQGILMSRAYDYGKTKEMLGARMLKPASIVKFFEMARGVATIVDNDNILRIEQRWRDGNYQVSVPKSKRQGGVYYLDSDLINIIGDDFVTSGNRMTANVYDSETLRKLVQYVLGEQADYFVAMTNKDVAVQINEQSRQDDSPALSASDTAEPVAVEQMLPTGKIVDQVAELLKQFKTTIPVSVIDNQRDILSDDLADDRLTVSGITHRGKIYLVRDGLPTMEAVVDTLFHEMLHYGIRRFVPANEYIAQMKKLYRSDPWIQAKAEAWLDSVEGVEYHKRAAERFGKSMAPDLSAARAVDEALAMLAEELHRERIEKSTSVIDRLADVVKNVIKWLADLAAKFKFAPTKTALAELQPGPASKAFVESIFRKLKDGEPHVMSQNNLAFSDPAFHAAWHGSPHDHDKFTTEKIGTGEGAQAYGWGMYFASAKDVAQWYRDSLSQDANADQKLTEGDVETILQDPKLEVTNSALEVIRERGIYGDGVTWRDVQDIIDAWGGDGASYTKEVLQRYWFDVSPVLGKLYEVELAPSEDEYLDWDKTYSEQSDFVKNALGRPNEWLKLVQDHGNRPLSGMGIYKSLEDKFISDKQASEYLHSIGIRGVRYLDGSSRGTSGGEIVNVWEEKGKWFSRVKVTNRGGIGFSASTDTFTTSKPYQTESEARSWAESVINSGNHNYVIFNDEDVSITAKYSKGGKSTNVSPSDIRTALIDRFGAEGISNLESAGTLKVMRLKDAPANVRKAAEAENASALYVNGVAYLFSDRMTAEQAPGKLLHEIGEHYGLERMIGKSGYAALMKRVATMAKVRGSVAYGAWQGVKANYGEFKNMNESELAGNERFMHEVLAAIGENQQGQATSLWRELLAKFKAWLADKGILADWMNEGDIANLVSGSLKKVMRNPSKPESIDSIYNEVILETIDFWKEFKDGIANPEGIKGSNKQISSRLVSGYAQAKRGAVRYGRLSDNEGVFGQEVIEYPDESIAGFVGYTTSVKRAKFGSDAGFILYVTPNELLQVNASTSISALNDNSVLQIQLINDGGDSYSLGVGEAIEGSTAYKALSDRGRIEKTDHFDKDGRQYNKLILDNPSITMHALMTEAARRISVIHGDVPSVTFPSRDTGARAGRDMARTYSPEMIQAYFSKSSLVAAPTMDQIVIDNFKQIVASMKAAKQLIEECA